MRVWSKRELVSRGWFVLARDVFGAAVVVSENQMLLASVTNCCYCCSNDTLSSRPPHHHPLPSSYPIVLLYQIRKNEWLEIWDISYIKTTADEFCYLWNREIKWPSGWKVTVYIGESKRNVRINFPHFHAFWGEGGIFSRTMLAYSHLGNPGSATAFSVHKTLKDATS